jgi:hypothetical protein
LPSPPFVRVNSLISPARALSSSLLKGRETRANGATAGKEKAPARPEAKSFCRYSSSILPPSLWGMRMINRKGSGFFPLVFKISFPCYNNSTRKSYEI